MTLLAVMLISVAAAQGPANDVERAAHNKAIATRVFEEIFNQGKLEVAREIYAPDFRNHGLHRDASLEEDQAAVRAERAAFPDLRISVDMLVAEGDLVTALWTFRGTHTHEGYAGLPATGARVEMRGMTIWRVVDGRIRDEWTTFNELGAYRQVLSRLKWVLAGILALAVVAIVALERSAVWAFKMALGAWRKARAPATTSTHP